MDFFYISDALRTLVSTLARADDIIQCGATPATRIYVRKTRLSELSDTPLTHCDRHTCLK